MVAIALYCSLYLVVWFFSSFILLHDISSPIIPLWLQNGSNLKPSCQFPWIGMRTRKSGFPGPLSTDLSTGRYRRVIMPQKNEIIKVYGKIVCDFANSQSNDEAIDWYFKNLTTELNFSEIFLGEINTDMKIKTISENSVRICPTSSIKKEFSFWMKNAT